MNGALVAAVFQAWRADGAIRLENEGDAGHSLDDAPAGQASDNPLRKIDIPKKALYIMFGVAIVGSIISANIFTVSTQGI